MLELELKKQKKSSEESTGMADDDGLEESELDEEEGDEESLEQLAEEEDAEEETEPNY